MIAHHITNAIDILSQLNNTIKQDIQNIKIANHSNLDKSIEIKNTLLRQFETEKSKLDLELVKVVSEKSGTELANILTDNEKAKLGELKDALSDLQKNNKEYSRYVVIIKEYYDSLSKKLFGTVGEGYNNRGEQNYKADFKLKV